ncbi:MAG: hypothetical protein KKC03_13550 [Bacteroidetes bacterium]|nr:hypothetical protein [Bacteroidota bacterium]
MRQFKDVQDLEEWLDPLSYEEFWALTDPFEANKDSRDHCAREIARGIDPETILICLKGMTRLAVIREQELKYRYDFPDILLH